MVCLVSTILSSVAWAGPVSFRAEIKPIGVINSPDNDGLGVRYSDFGGSYSELLDGSASYLGTVQLGLELDASVCYFDLLVGGGFSGNGGFAGGLFTGDVGCRFKINKAGTFAIGPFFGFISPVDTEWEAWGGQNEGTIDMQGNPGIQGGLKLTGGWKHVGLVLQLGYAQYGYDLSADNPWDWEIQQDNGGWVPYVFADKEIKMDGFFGQFGVSVQF